MTGGWTSRRQPPRVYSSCSRLANTLACFPSHGQGSVSSLTAVLRIGVRRTALCSWHCLAPGTPLVMSRVAAALSYGRGAMGWRLPSVPATTWFQRNNPHDPNQYILAFSPYCGWWPMATVLQVGGYAKLVLSVGNWAWHLSISCCSNIVPGEAALSSLGAGFGQWFWAFGSQPTIRIYIGAVSVALSHKGGATHELPPSTLGPPGWGCRAFG